MPKKHQTMIRETPMETNKGALLLATILLAGPVAAAAPQYTVTNLGVLDGYSSSYGSGINESGQVAGYSYNSDGDQLAFLFSNGTLQSLGTLGGTRSAAYGINASGRVTGYSPYTSRAAAFLYSNGTMYGPLAGPEGLHSSLGYGINASGQITGGFTPGACCPDLQAFLYSNGTTQNLGTLGAAPSTGFGINASGQVTGYSRTASQETHAFLYSNGSMCRISSDWTPLISSEWDHAISG
jgi:probable HAF family extracellular repeat protein